MGRNSTNEGKRSEGERAPMIDKVPTFEEMTIVSTVLWGCLQLSNASLRRPPLQSMSTVKKSWSIPLWRPSKLTTEETPASVTMIQTALRKPDFWA